MQEEVMKRQIITYVIYGWRLGPLHQILPQTQVPCDSVSNWVN